MVDDESGEHENNELPLAVGTYWTNEYSNNLYILLIRQSWNLSYTVNLSIVGYYNHIFFFSLICRCLYTLNLLELCIV